jgi:LAO/AO transport system kinase
MEIADLFVINKSDRPGTDKLERALLAMLSFAHRPDGWIPPVVKTVATDGQGIEELLMAVEQCQSHFEASGIRTQKKRQAVQQRLLTLLQERLVNEAMARHFPGDALHRVVDEIVNRDVDPYTVVDSVVKKGNLH